MKVTLPDGKELSLPGGASGRDLARELGGKWPQRAVGAEVNGEPRDLGRELPEGAVVRLLAENSPEGRDMLRHSAAHVMAAAIQRVIPGTRLAIGPAIENGFYYDVDAPRRITQEDFPAIEKEMAALIEADEPFARSEKDRAAALAEAERTGDKFKAELIRDLPEGEALSFYRCGDFEDLCRGPHLPSTGRVKAVKLLSVAGAYWRGDAEREQLQRVYGTAFEDPKELKKHLAFLEEAKKRDHRALARQLDLYSMDGEIGPGLVTLPAGGADQSGCQPFVYHGHEDIPDISEPIEGLDADAGGVARSESIALIDEVNTGVTCADGFHEARVGLTSTEHAWRCLTTIWRSTSPHTSRNESSIQAVWRRCNAYITTYGVSCHR